MATNVRLAEWEIREIKNALRIAAEDGAYDDVPGLGDTIDKLQQKMTRALERARTSK